MRIQNIVILLLVIVSSACSDSDFSPFTSKTNDYEESRSVDVTFRDLVQTIKDKSGKALCLNEPASDDLIARAEQVVGKELPSDVKKVYKIANGQRDGEACLPLFLSGFQFLSLEDMMQQWRFMKQMAEEEGPDFTAMYDIQGPVKGYHWSLNWVPIGFAITGDLLVIDFEPAESGQVGQIVEFIHDDTFRYHWGRNFNSYLGYIQKGLLSGEFVYREDWGVITEK